MNLKEKARRAEEAANRAAAVETADKLRNCTVKITAKGGANGKLFGAITGKEISEALMAQFGLDVGKQKIVLVSTASSKLKVVGRGDGFVDLMASEHALGVEE